METQGGFLSRVAERALGWVALAGVVAVGIAVWQMPGETKAAIWSAVWRTAAWLVLAAAMPWSAALFIRRVTEAGTNWAGVALLAVLLAVDLVAGVLLMTAWPNSGWAWFAVLGLLAVAGIYNYLVTEYLAERA